MVRSVQRAADDGTGHDGPGDVVRTPVVDHAMMPAM
jgi:hypothetical protein